MVRLSPFLRLSRTAPAHGSFPWRNAASAILVAKDARAPDVPSASAAPKRPSEDTFDYKVLMLQRSSKSKFMPNAYVFPGGAISEADFSQEWRELFNRYGKRSVDELVHSGPENPNVTRPFLMESSGDEEEEEERCGGRGGGGGLPREAAFRLCALRETFEESGVFLHEPTSSPPDPELMARYRPLVHRDPRQLLSLCREARVVPDLWGLCEFADWLTPLGRTDTSGRRFDTIFYAAFLEEEEDGGGGAGSRHATTDAVEVTDAVWTNPCDIMTDARKEKLWLAPPQVYELYRLRMVHSFDSLRSGCLSRAARRHLPTWMPIFVQLRDCIISVLPGDDLYPEDPDYEGLLWTGAPEKWELSLEDVCCGHPTMNRLAIYSLYDVRAILSHDMMQKMSLARR